MANKYKIVACTDHNGIDRTALNRRIGRIVKDIAPLEVGYVAMVYYPNDSWWHTSTVEEIAYDGNLVIIKTKSSIWTFEKINKGAE